MEKATEILNDELLRKKAEILVFKCGIRADLSGYTYLIDACMLRVSKTVVPLCDIYEVIGERVGLRPKTVLRAITYALQQTPELNANLNKLLGVNVPGRIINSGVVISYICKLIESPELLATPEILTSVG